MQILRGTKLNSRDKNQSIVYFLLAMTRLPGGYENLFHGLHSTGVQQIPLL